MGGNQIKRIDSLKALKQLDDLREIDLLACPLTNDTDYRDKIFAILDKLEIVDNMDKDGIIIESDVSYFILIFFFFFWIFLIDRMILKVMMMTFLTKTNVLFFMFRW